MTNAADFAGLAPFRAGDRLETDERYRDLVGPAPWDTLPPAVRARFTRRLGARTAIVYGGEIISCRVSRAGWLLARLGRLIGGPLPLDPDVAVAAVVTVTEDSMADGQVWTRIYGRARGLPQVVQSTKRFTGPTGLEEHIGGGFGIALALSVEPGGLRLVSDHYFWSAGRLRLRLPRWLCPGTLTIRHIDRAEGRFEFTLALHHPLLGEVLAQTVMFRERADPG